jgi:hypothetical protein
VADRDVRDVGMGARGCVVVAVNAIERLGPTRTGIQALAAEIEEIDAAMPAVEERLVRAIASEDRARARRWEVEREKGTLTAQRDAALTAIKVLRDTLPEGAWDGISEVAS